MCGLMSRFYKIMKNKQAVEKCYRDLKAIKNKRAKAKVVLLSIKKSLEKNGFKVADMKVIRKYMKRYKVNLGVETNSLIILNRGKDSNKSNYFVFMGIAKKRHGEYGVNVLFYNPAVPKFLKGEPMKYVEPGEKPAGMQDPTDRKFVFSINEYKTNEDARDFIETTVFKALYLASHKPKNRYFVSPHSHIGKFRLKKTYLNGKIVRNKEYNPITLKPKKEFGNKSGIDDGKTDIVDALLTTALYGLDFFAMTSHNSFCVKVYEEMKPLADALGIKIIPGFEITMPIYGFAPEDVGAFIDMLEKRGVDKKEIWKDLHVRQDNTFDYTDVEQLIKKYRYLIKKGEEPQRIINGPHVVVHCKNAKIAKEINDNLLHKIRDVKYPPLSSPNIQLEKTIRQLKKQYGNDVAIYLAHPFNENSLPHVGIGMRMKIGDLSIKTIKKMIEEKLIDGIAAYNPGIGEEKQTFEYTNGTVQGTKDKKMKKIIEKRKKMKKENIRIAKIEILKAVDEKWWQPAITSNALNIALARYLNKYSQEKTGEYLKEIGEPDIHWYGQANLKNPSLNHFGRTITYVQMPEKEMLDKNIESLFEAQKKHKKTGSPFFNYIAYAFYDNKEMKMKFEKGREPKPEEKQAEILASYQVYATGFFKVILKDIKNRIRRLNLFDLNFGAWIRDVITTIKRFSRE